MLAIREWAMMEDSCVKRTNERNKKRDTKLSKYTHQVRARAEISNGNVDAWRKQRFVRTMNMSSYVTYAIIEWVITNCKYSQFYLLQREQQHFASWWFCLFQVVRRDISIAKYTPVLFDDIFSSIFILKSDWESFPLRSYFPSKQTERENEEKIYQSLTIALSRTNGVTTCWCLLT